MSETSKCRTRMEKFCIGYGVDLGYGGDLIIPSAISIDRDPPQAHVGDYPLNLGGDARNLYWFKDSVLDYVFSSHLLEDFEDTLPVLKEWFRVLKPGGNLVLFCPDEQVYREHCKSSGQCYNFAHKIANFGLSYVKNLILGNFKVAILHELPLTDIYSFDLVVKKL